MRKIKWKQILLLAGAAAMLGGCGGKDTVKSVKKSGVLRVAVYEEADADEQVVKASDRLLDSLSEALGAEIEKAEAGTAEEAAALVERGEADMAVGSLTEEAASGRACDTSSSYAEESVLIVTRRGDYSDCTAAFEGRFLGAQPALAGEAETLTADQEDVTVDASVESGDAASKLEQGSLDGYICLRGAAEKLIEEKGEALQAQSLIAAEPREYCALVPSKDRKFRQGVNQLIQSMEEPEEEQTEE